MITSSFKHAVSDIFIIMFSERAPLEMTYISMSKKILYEGAYFHVSESNLRGSEATKWGCPPPRAEKVCIWSPEKKFLMHIWGNDH